MNSSAPAPMRPAARATVNLLPHADVVELPKPPGPDVIGQCALTRKIHEYDPKADTSVIDAAYHLAEQAHATQRRENGDPYFSHPVAVADILAGYRLDVASIATALLHDVVEDTSCRLTEIEARFGKEIAGLVDGVTKLTRLELQSDRTKQAENFRKLVLAMSRDIRVLLVKLADRLHNMRTLHFVRDPDRRKRISRETMEIYAPLAERIGMDAVKTELQTLSFTQLEPEAYATILARLNFLRGQGADVIDDVRLELIQVCRSAGVEPVEITGREKSPFSIWEKMHRRNVAFEQLSDIMAFRIVVQTKADCYAALGAVHSAYPVIAGRFKDYISTAKSNGYQSLHTGVTLRQPRNQKIEVQIRTIEMNDVAENGVASHWVYKTPDKKVDGTDVQRFRWVQDLLDILDDSAAPDDFLENTKLELYADQVFCFTPKGQLIQLPRGATPVDFAYAVHSQVGDTCVGAKINGRLMPLRHHLENGDQVEIMTARGGTPSPQWDRFVVTGKAPRPHPPLHPSGATPAKPRQRPRRADQGLPPGRCRRLGKGAGAGAEGAEGRHRRGPLHRRRQRQPGRSRRRSRRIPGTAAGAARAADDPADAAARQGAGPPRPRHAGHRPGAGNVLQLRRLLPSGSRRRHRGHCHHRQGCHHPRPRLPDADRVRRHARAFHRCRMEL